MSRTIYHPPVENGRSSFAEPGAARRLAVPVAAVLAVSCLPSQASAQVPGTTVPAEHVMPAVEQAYAMDDARMETAAAGLEAQDVELVDVDLCIDPERYRLSATAKLTVRATSTVIEFSLNEDLAILSVESGESQLRFLRDGANLAIRPGQSRDEFLEVSVSYEGVLTPGDDVRLSKGLVYLGERALWYPTPSYGDRFRLRAVVRYPEGYTSVCTGALAGMTPSREGSPEGCVLGDVWETGVPVPCAAVAVGTFASSYSVWGDVFLGVHLLVDPGDGPAPDTDVIATDLKGLVRYLENCYGPYPFDWLSVVAVPGFASGRPAAGTAPGFILTTEFDPTHSGLSEVPPDRLVGALSRSWWPYSVDAGIVVSDGLAGNSEVNLLRDSGDEEGAVRRRERWRDVYVSALADSGGRAPLLSCMAAGVTPDARVCATRSAAFMGILEEIMGRDAFCSALRNLDSRFSGEAVSLRDVIAAFDKADGRDLSWLVYEWVCRGGLPTYVLSYEVSESRRGYVVTGAVRQLGEIFRTPIPLTVDLGVWSYDEWVPVESSEQTFTFSTELEPQSITIDSASIIPRIEADELANVHFERGVRAVEANEWGRAVDEFGAASSLVPDEAEYRKSYGQALVHSGRTTLGLAALDEAVALNPDDADGRLKLAQLYLAAGRSEDALRHMDRYVKRRPNDPAGHAVRAMALVKLGRTSAAGEELSAATALVDSQGAGEGALELLSLARGRFHEAVGETDLAAQAYREALEHNPVSDEARRALARLAASSG